MLSIDTAYCYCNKTFKRKHLLFVLVYCLLPFMLFSQDPEIPATAKQQLENITENNADVEIEDDSYLQQMQYFIKHPINLNTADENDLLQLKLLNPIQVQNLLLYRNLLGKFISIYELQAIPGWNVAVIHKIKPYIVVSNEIVLLTTIRKRLQGGENSILIRASQILEKSKGFLIDSSSATNFYPGSPQKILIRYKYQYKNLLQYGVLGEKDAGEQFFKGKQKQGFDFYSVHFFAKSIGIIKSLALGDFTVNLGQGLTQWQTLADKKSADVLNIKREADVLQPYNSSGEINFHRGGGITIAKNKWGVTFFVSYKKIDANLMTDTVQNHEDFISSFQTSGYHRTKSETDDKGVQRQFTFGGNFSYKYRGFNIGLNGIQYKFKLPVNKSNDPYNLYALSGNSFGNYSLDYSYTFKNLHWFGEAAISSNLYKAFINGILISVSSNADMSFLYRNISKGYQSLYATAFTESTYPANEKGAYAGLSVHPGSVWQIDMYTDLYKFPWLRYNVDAPSAGSDYLIQLSYKPNKQLEILSRFRSESKSGNFNPDQITLTPVVTQPKQSWRTQFEYKPNAEMQVGSRVEMLWFNKNTPQEEHGVLIYNNFSYEPLSMPWAANIRFQYFETDSYNSRMYAYESDVLYGFSIPVFYDKGIRYYINTNYDVNKKLGLWLKWAQTIYPNKSLIGSGLDEIKGSKKSEIKVQVLYKF